MDPAEDGGTARHGGQRAVRLSAHDWRDREPAFPGTRVAIVVDETLGGADLYGGIIVLEPGATVDRHWHSRGEWQFVLSGSGVFVDVDGREHPVTPRSSVFGPPGVAGAHGFRNTGGLPLEILFVYASPGGRRPDLTTIGRSVRHSGVVPPVADPIPPDGRG